MLWCLKDQIEAMQNTRVQFGLIGLHQSAAIHASHSSIAFSILLKTRFMSNLPEPPGPEFSEKIHSRKPTSATGCGPECRRNRRFEATLGAALPASATFMCTSPARRQRQMSAANLRTLRVLEGLPCGLQPGAGPLLRLKL